MKIELLEDLPVDPKHQAKAGNIYDAEFAAKGGRGAVCYWITGATGERVGVLAHEG